MKNFKTLVAFIAARSREHSTMVALATLLIAVTGSAIDPEHFSAIAGLIGGLLVIAVHPDATTGE